MDNKIKKEEEQNQDEINQSNVSKQEEPAQGNTFWKKLGSAVKKAVDCCLEG